MDAKLNLWKRAVREANMDTKPMDIIERLNDPVLRLGCYPKVDTAINAAIAEIERLRAENARLRSMLHRIKCNPCFQELDWNWPEDAILWKYV